MIGVVVLENFIDPEEPVRATLRAPHAVDGIEVEGDDVCQALRKLANAIARSEERRLEIPD